MKLYSTLLGVMLAAVMTAATAGAEVIDHLGVPGPIQFDGQRYELAWTAMPAADYVKQEYVPDGQTPETFSQMLLVERIVGDIAGMDAVRSQVDMLNQRKASDPLVNMDLIQQKQTGEVLLDFIISARDEEGEMVVEWSAYRYAPYSGRGGESGVLLFGVSHRAYGDEGARAFLTELKQLRPAQIQALAAAPLPEPGE